ncbi:two-partner secretion domain-containing protein [Hydrogenophaga sp.]|uniref:two-partner secretion domain-containing protein n=1 Tax=Hydrogenophaga sp. TaxID=1904254 RepID=UPI002FC8295F
MNRTHRLVWNTTRCTWQAVSETAAARGPGGGLRRAARRQARGLAALALACAGTAALAGPQGGQVTLGSASVAQSGSTTTITQTSAQTAIDWQSFSVDAGETVRFVQPGAQSVALNRVLGTEASHILGRFSANGQVFLLNPNGVLFGTSARVDVGGLVASTLSLSNEDFAAGRMQLRGTSTGSVSNAGQITAAEGGYVVLAAPQVHNSGTISTHLGHSVLAAGEHVTLQLQGGGLLGYRIERGALQALVEQAGHISADGGAILIEAKALDALASAVVNHSGISQARTVQEREGRIVLLGDMAVGRTHVDGTLDASASEGGNGGFIETSAATVKVADGARITTSAAQGTAGTWLIDPTDFTIAATGGDISGATLSAALASSNVVLDSTAGAQDGAGDLFVRDQVSWSANRLTLRAQRDIHLYQDLVGSGSAQLTMAYGLASDTGAGSDYHLHNATRVYLPEGLNLSLQQGRLGTDRTYQVITQGSGFTGINNDLTGHYALGGSISGVSATENVIGGEFTGQFHGLGHQLVGFSVSASGAGRDFYVGMFRVVGTASVLRDFQLINGLFFLTGAELGVTNYFGTLAAINNGLIHKVYSNSRFYNSGDFQAGGGLVAINNGTIRQSQVDLGFGFTSTGLHANWLSNNGGSPVGQIAGINTGLIEDSVGSSRVSTSAPDYTSVFIGLVGSNTGTLNRSYATFPDNQVHDNNIARTLTEAEMKQAATYAGWSIGSDADGDSVWRIHEGESTPLLRDFRRRVDMQTQLTFNGETQAEGSVSGRDAGFYAATIDMKPLGQEVTGGLTITPALLSVSSTDVNRIYDGSTDATGAAARIVSGQLFGADSLSGGSFAFTDRHVGTGKTVNVQGVTVVDGNGGANYALTLVDNTSSSIAAAPLQLSVDPTSKVYDGTTDATTTWHLSSGSLFGTDTLDSARLSFDTRHAGDNKRLLLSDAVLSDGNGGANYTLTLADNAGSNITPAPLVLTADAAYKAYDGNTDAQTTWHVSSGTLFGTDALSSVALSYDTAEIGINKTLHLSEAVLADGNGGANYTITLADNADSRIAAANAGTLRLAQAVAAVRQAPQPDPARVPNGQDIGTVGVVEHLLVVDCGIQLPPGASTDNCHSERLLARKPAL